MKKIEQKNFKVMVPVEKVHCAVVTIDISFDPWSMKDEEPRPVLEIYKHNWLKLSNHKRETSEFLALENFYGSNFVEIVLNIDGSSIEEAEIFCGQFGRVIDVEEKDVLIHDFSGYWDGVTGARYDVYLMN